MSTTRRVRSSTRFDTLLRAARSGDLVTLRRHLNEIKECDVAKPLFAITVASLAGNVTAFWRHLRGEKIADEEFVWVFTQASLHAAGNAFNFIEFVLDALPEELHILAKAMSFVSAASILHCGFQIKSLPRTVSSGERLIAAAAASDLPAMLHVIRQGVDVNMATANLGMTALCVAASGDPEAIRMLLAAGAAEGPADSLNMALAIAIEHTQTSDDISRVDLLLEARADVNCTVGGVRPLALALRGPHNRPLDVTAQLAEHLIDAGADAQGEMPVVAVFEPDPHLRGIGRKLMEAGAGTQPDAILCVALFAAMRCQPEFLRFLFSIGADPNGCLDDVSPLIMHFEKAEPHPSKEIIEILFQAGANMECALGEWCRSKIDDSADDILSYLINECGVNIDAQIPSERQMALSLACRRSDLLPVKLLLKHGAELNATPERQIPAVCSAASSQQAATYEYLTVRGADVFFLTCITRLLKSRAEEWASRVSRRSRGAPNTSGASCVGWPSVRQTEATWSKSLGSWRIWKRQMLKSRMKGKQRGQDECERA